MLNFFELDCLVREYFDPPIAPMHSNYPKNTRVVDQGQHLDRKLRDTSKSVPMRPDDAMRSTNEPTAIDGPLAQINKLDDGGIATIIYNIVTSNPQKYPVNQQFLIGPLVAALKSERYKNKNGDGIQTAKDENVKNAIYTILANPALPVPLFEKSVRQDPNGRKEHVLTIKDYKASPTQVKPTISPQAQKKVLDPNEGNPTQANLPRQGKPGPATGGKPIILDPVERQYRDLLGQVQGILKQLDLYNYNPEMEQTVMQLDNLADQILASGNQKLIDSATKIKEQLPLVMDKMDKVAQQSQPAKPTQR